MMKTKCIIVIIETTVYLIKEIFNSNESIPFKFIKVEMKLP